MKSFRCAARGSFAQNTTRRAFHTLIPGSCECSRRERMGAKQSLSLEACCAPRSIEHPAEIQQCHDPAREPRDAGCALAAAADSQVSTPRLGAAGERLSPPVKTPAVADTFIGHQTQRLLSCCSVKKSPRALRDSAESPISPRGRERRMERDTNEQYVKNSRHTKRRVSPHRHSQPSLPGYPFLK